MLRKIRIFAATFCFVLITLLFLDFTGTIHAWFGWLAKIQFWPALLALNVGVVVGLIILTLLLGRVYCSVICPLGVLQDIISWFASKRKKYRFSYSPALKWVRYGTLVIFILACIAGIGSLVALISPYSAYGRIASNLFAPIYQEGNNLLAYFAERMDSYAFYSVDVWVRSLATMGIAILSFVILAILAWRNGRRIVIRSVRWVRFSVFCRSMLYLNLALIPINVMVADYAHVNARLPVSILRIMRSIIAVA